MPYFFCCQNSVPALPLGEIGGCLVEWDSLAMQFRRRWFGDEYLLQNNLNSHCKFISDKPPSTAVDYKLSSRPNLGSSLPVFDCLFSSSVSFTQPSLYISHPHFIPPISFFRNNVSGFVVAELWFYFNFETPT